MLKNCLLLIGYVLLVLGLSQATYSPDYEYIQGVGWLRLHIVPATWPDAQLRCHLEDATLTAPTTSAITAVMKNTMRAHRLAEGSVFTDIYASNPKGAYTRLPRSNITLQWAVGEPNNVGNGEDCLVMTGAGELADVSCSSVRPFFCLKRNTTSNCNENECNCTVEANQCNTTQEVKPCDTTAEGYTLKPLTGSCYKFHRDELPWRRAAMKCASERAHLAIINNEGESQVIRDMITQNQLLTGDTIYLAHIGVLDWNERGQWLTVFGETLDEAGFNKWESGRPNNSNNGHRYCGSVDRAGMFYDIPCTSVYSAYICEISPKL